ncbi:MAG TPA: metallopeptidase TldD-related protein [Terriglobales bacterium]|nr:metallopeptidase TldD-related protein [Terriglobales bacterium]
MRTRAAGLIVLLFFAVAGLAQENKIPDPVLATMKQELTRSFEVLKKSPVPPYFLSYQLTDNHDISVSSSFGALASSTDNKSRVVDIDLRVGDYNVDNTHPVSRAFATSTFGQTRGTLPIEDDPAALAVALWLETDRNYRNAVQQFEGVKTDRQIKPADSERSPDFSAAPPQHYSEPDAPFSFDRKLWEEKVRRFGQVFRGNPDILGANISASGELETRRYVNSDGSEIKISAPLYRLTIYASVRASDGEVLPLQRNFMSFTPEGMPSDETVLKAANEMLQMLLALQKAPVAEPYTGPAILSGRASAVFFHEIFGHRIEGDRMNDDDDAQTFKNKINQLVLPKFLSVYADPTLRQLYGTDLVGHYLYDDEGVKANRVTVVDKGIFRNFLLSRSPVKGFAQSNGHGRRQQGYDVEARQSNLLVEASQTVPRAALKKMLIDRLKKSKKPYGLLFADIEGGFTTTSRSIPNAFSVLPTVVYRIYADGREELVRGLDLIGTPLIAFSKIAAADDSPEVFNGVCGAQSGWVPVSASAPGLLIEQIEVQRKEKAENPKPILPSPSGASK